MGGLKAGGPPLQNLRPPKAAATSARMAEPTWFEDMAKRVREVQRDEAGHLTTESYLHVCEGNLKIFTVIFNGYVTAEAPQHAQSAPLANAPL